MEINLCIKLLQFIIKSGWDSATTEEYQELMKQCNKALEKEHDYNWLCGCGHWNGANLAVCAMCGRTPSESYPIQERS